MQGSIQWFYLLCLAVFGLIFGSFANVVIWRFPRGESLAHPGSHCPVCGHPIRPVDNIPIVSWLLLGRRCRDCGTPISWRYPAVEALSGALWVAAGAVYGLSLQAGVAIVLFYLLLILSFIDLDTMRLPNGLVGLLAMLGAAAVVLSQLTGIEAAPLTPTPGAFLPPVVDAAAGVLVGGGFLALVSIAYGLLRRRRGMGMGDIKLVSAAGLYLGPYVMLALLIGSAVGLVGGLALTSGDAEGPVGRRRFPFGPFLAIGIVATALAGPALLHWYATAMGL